MRIYCADLLDEFEGAVDARSVWILRHREEIDLALRNGRSPEELDLMAREAGETTAQLEAARDRLSLLIREQFPMGLPER